MDNPHRDSQHWSPACPDASSCPCSRASPLHPASTSHPGSGPNSPSYPNRDPSPIRLDKYNRFYPSPPRHIDRFITKFDVDHWRRTAHLQLSAEGRAIWLNPEMAPARPEKGRGWTKDSEMNRTRDWMVQRSKGYAILVNSLGDFKDPVMNALGRTQAESEKGITQDVAESPGKNETPSQLQPVEAIEPGQDSALYLRDEAPLWKVEADIIRFFETEKRKEFENQWQWSRDGCSIQ